LRSLWIWQQGRGDKETFRKHFQVLTIRHQIIDLLSKEDLSAIELSQELGIREREIYDHLPHIARSVAAQGRRLVMEPSRCLKCGYVFEDRKRFTRPSRCPRCKGTYLQRPSYRIC
jgi:predicted Zn-ribbon and HTH transcriptional regulator